MTIISVDTFYDSVPVIYLSLDFSVNSFLTYLFFLLEHFARASLFWFTFIPRVINLRGDPSQKSGMFSKVFLLGRP